jgi:integrase/recombinase XerD
VKQHLAAVRMLLDYLVTGGVLPMNKVEDYYQNGKHWWCRLYDKGDKRYEAPAHHNAEAYMDSYLEAAGLWQEKKGPLVRRVGRHREVTERPMHRNDVLGMMKRRVREAGLPERTCCHTFRALGIMADLENGGTIEHAQAIAAHEPPRTIRGIR